MATRSQRFGICNEKGARSSEWIVMWKTTASDVYLVTRTLGTRMKASLHESGQCRIRGPKANGRSSALLLDKWNIDPSSAYTFPLSIVFPEPELSDAPFSKHREKGTVWVQATAGAGVEIAVMLVRRVGDMSDSLRAADWHTEIVDTPLPDGRRLIVVGGSITIPPERYQEIELIKPQAAVVLTKMAPQAETARLLLLTGDNEQGTRKVLEVAATRRE